MKLILAIIQAADEADSVQELNKRGFFVTKLSTTGGFLKAKNTTLLIGTDDEKVDNLIKAIEDLKKELNIPLSIKDWGISKEDFTKAMETLPTLAFDDQCTGSNPRYPLIEEIEKLYWYAYEGNYNFNL